MKVGIITFQSAHNYGAVLQCWSLQEYLKSCGHDVDVINFRPDVIDKVYALIKVSDVKFTDSKKVNAMLKGVKKAKHRIDNRVRFPGRIEKYKKFEKFIKTKLHVTEPYYTVSELEGANLKYDVLIAGSDQIWNPELTKSFRAPYFLSFGNKDAIRIAYAASIGTDNIKEEYRLFMQRQLDDFDAISVRENASKEVIEKLVDKNVEVVTDPTFLARMDSFKKLEIKPNVSEPYIYVHNVHLDRVDKNLMAMAKAVSERLNLPIIHNRTDYHFKRELRTFSGGVEEYLGLIHNAAFVVTNSFHTTVFSIRYKKKFISVPHITSPGRVSNLLGTLDLMERFTGNPNELPKDLKNWDIDYDTVTKIMQDMADESAKFLNNAIQNDKKQNEYNYLQFENKFKCYSCGACMHACTDGAIEMKEDENGFSYPVKDEKLYGDSGTAGCDVCPRLHPGVDKPPVSKVFAAYAKNEKEYEHGSMGGVLVPAFGEVLKDNAVIVGPVLDKDYNTIYAMAETVEGCKDMINPMFVMPEKGDIFKRTKKVLDEGRQVLFVGDSCQISALKNYLGKIYENLLTVDYLCRGTGSPKALKEYLSGLEELYDSKIADIRMGYKLQDSDVSYVRILFENGGMEFVREEVCGYLMDIAAKDSLMPSCHECQFLEPDKSIADITLGDYRDIKELHPEFGKNKGVSLIKINSEKGLELFEKIKDKLELKDSSLKELINLKNRVDKEPEIKKDSNKMNRMLGREHYIRCYEKSKIKKNTILFISKNGDDLAGNMFYLLAELQHEKYKNFNIYLSCNDNIRGWVETLFLKYGIKNVILIEHGGNKYMQLLASAEYLFTDTSFDLRYTKKKGQIIVNTWHGTPLKLMGKRVTTCKYEYGNVQKNLAMADYLIAPSDFMIDVMVDSYGVTNLSAGKVLYSGYPRNSVFFDGERSMKMKKQLGFEGKNVYVYMPTWRGTLNKKKMFKTNYSSQWIDEESLKMLDVFNYYFSELDDKLTDNDIFLVKLHPFVNNVMDLSKYKHIVAFPTEYETYDVINAADGLVTDYSSVFFDFAITHKKIILFAYDYEEYKNERGMYCDLEELPFPVVRSVSDLVNEMHSGIEYNDEEFIKEYCTYDRTDAAKVICERVLLGKSGCKEAPVKNNGKENVIIYVAGLHLNGLTSAILNVLNNLDRTKRNYFACVPPSISKNPERIKKLPDNVEVIPLKGGLIVTAAEKVAIKLYYGKNMTNSAVTKMINGIFKREAERYFGGFVYQHSIQYTGYEKDMINLFEKMHGNRTIFVHNDMVQEMATRNNQHKPTIRNAYANYNHVAAVSKDIYPTVFKLGATKKNATVVNNCIDYKGIYERGFGEIEFDETTESNVSIDKLKEILDSSEKKFINVARFSPEKGHSMLIDAFDMYYKEDHDSYLIIIGGHGKEYKSTLSHAASKDSRDHIIFIKSMNNPMPVLKRCDLFVLSSIYEGLGLVLLEAIIQGVPVMSTNIKGPQGFMLEHGGYLVDVSADGIYQGMKKFAEEGIEPLTVDFEEYNRKAVKEFEDLFMDAKGKHADA